MTTSAKTHRIAVIGCGDIAETGHLPAILDHERFELAALCDVRRERCELLARKSPGTSIHHHHRELLDDPRIDAVVLALHPEVSVDVAIDFLSHGKPVLDEKPLAATWVDGKRLEQCVRQTRGVYQIGFVLRHCEAVRTVSELAARLGTPALYRVAIFDERLDRADEAHFNRIQQILRNSSAITHQASHVFDFFRLWNANRFVSAYATALQTERDFSGPNVWSAQLTVADGSVLQVDVGWLLPSAQTSVVTIHGPRGFLSLDLQTGQGKYAIDDEVQVIRSGPLAQNWRRQLDIFSAAIDRREAMVATIEDGLRALEASLACEASHKSWSAVPVGSK